MTCEKITIHAKLATDAKIWVGINMDWKLFRLELIGWELIQVGIKQVGIERVGIYLGGKLSRLELTRLELIVNLSPFDLNKTCCNFNLLI